jgi:photosystem II stability/assembly factor-like uncharacterized protein
MNLAFIQSKGNRARQLAVRVASLVGVGALFACSFAGSKDLDKDRHDKAATTKVDSKVAHKRTTPDLNDPDVMRHILRWRHMSDSLVHDDDDGDKKSHGIPHQAFMDALKFRQLSLRNSDGSVDHLGRRKAMAQRNALIQSQGRTGLSANVLSFNGQGHGDPNYPLNWVERGPYNIPGRALSIAIHPTQTNKIWLGTAGGGIWSSNDAGNTWSPVSDWLPSLAVASIVFDPNNPSTMFAGTGEGYFNADAIQGAGLLESTDGGQTFNVVSGTSNWQDVDTIVVQKGNSNVILAGVEGQGIMRSTDGGQTWSNVLSIYLPYNIVPSPSNPNTLLASCTDANDNYVFISQNGGQTWARVTSGLTSVTGWLSRINVQYSVSNPNIAYAVVGDPEGQQSGSGASVWKSTDGGNNWTEQGTGTFADWYSAPIWIDPTNPDNIVVGSVDLYRSTDGGQTFNQITLWYLWSVNGNLPHADMHAFVSDPGFDGVTNRKLYIACDGGMFETDDIDTVTFSGGWNARSIGVRSSQFYGGDLDFGSGTLLGGLQDNGTTVNSLSTTSAFQDFGGDGGFASIDPTNANFLYGEYVDLEIHRATDGHNASSIYGGITDAGSNANFISPFILDPNNVNVMYAGGDSLWRSTNVKAPTPTWSAIRSPGSSLISAIAVAPNDSNTVWVGQNDGGVSKTTNASSATPTWTSITLPSEGRYIGRITIDPTNENNVYVGLGGFQSEALIKSTDGGQTWSDATGVAGSQLPAAPVRGIAIDPLAPTSIFAGTEVGLFWSKDSGQHWSTANAGPAAASVDEVRFGENGGRQLLAITHGRGLWTADLGGGTSTPTITAIPNQVVNQGQTLSLQIPGNDPDPGSVLTYNAVGSLPSGANLSEGGLFTWTPPMTIAGTYPVTVTATSDGTPPKTSLPATFNVIVKEVNRPVGIVNPGLQVVAPGSSIVVPINAVDPDQPATTAFTLTKVSGPSWITLNGLTMTISPPLGTRLGDYPTMVKAVSEGTNPPNQTSYMSFLVGVNSPTLTSFKFLSNPVVGGSTIQAKVSLAAPAPAGGLTVKVVAPDGLTTPPATVTVNAGQMSATFSLTTKAVTRPTVAWETASLGSIAIQSSLRLMPSLTFNEKGASQVAMRVSFRPVFF